MSQMAVHHFLCSNVKTVVNDESCNAMTDRSINTVTTFIV